MQLLASNFMLLTVFVSIKNSVFVALLLNINNSPHFIVVKHITHYTAPYK